MTLRVLMATSDQDVADLKEKATSDGRMFFSLPMKSRPNDDAVIFTHEGLYAYAKILTEPEPDHSFGKRPVWRAYVGEIKLIRPVIKTDEITGNDELEPAVEGWKWPTHPRRSFCTPAEEYAKTLRELVYKRLGKRVAPAKLSQQDNEDATSAKSSSAGYQSDQAKRDACEDYAMVLAEKHYKKKGFTVENKSSTQSYDFLCTKGKLVVHVEVKGTTTDGSEVELMIGEVKNARAKGWRTDLFVVSNIKLKKTNDVFVPSGGKERVLEDWQPDEEDLLAIRFRYKVPPPARAR